MSDRVKFIFAVIFFIAALVMPGLGFLVYLAGGASGQFDPTVSSMMWTSLGLVAVFLVFLAIAMYILYHMDDHNWVTVFTPYLTSVLYTILPDFIPFSLDDGAATTAGAIFTFLLALRKNPNTPRWVFFPLATAGIYAFFGGALPGPFDEIIVDGIAFLLAIYGMQQADKDDTIIEGEIVSDDEFPLMKK
jgi:hypothetical protein